MTHFALPESYRAWLKDAAVRSAVDHILSCKKLEVPADLEWDGLPDFHAAVLAAHQVRCDFATALHDLWKNVWKPALKDCGLADSLEPLSFNEQQELLVYPCDTYSLWESGVLDCVYGKGDHKVGLGVAIDLKQAWLTVWLLDGNDEVLTTSLDPGDAWNSEPADDGYLYSRDELSPISDDGIILDLLRRAAKRALQEIGGILGAPEQS